ncbi:MAG: LysR family transcriptional regulator [Acidihalobacter sp.]|uniref:LysR family transcriptional regulator n=1 Tax=Acidihalobacter sp. TaxID=1872108 RepID=UPI00307D1C84
MDLRQLRTFVAVAREGSLSRAAGQLFLSIPAASAQIRALEDEFEVRLFTRTSKGMYLTSAGRRLLDEAQATLDAAKHVTQTAEEIRGQLCGQACIGILTDSLSLRLGSIMAALAERHPKLDVRLQRDLSARVIHRTRATEFDGGFALSGSAPDGVEATFLACIDLTVVLPLRFEQEVHRLQLADLLAIPWVGSVSECALGSAMIDLFRPMDALPKMSRIADSDGAVRSLVAGGLGAGILRRTEAEEAVENGEVVIWPYWHGAVTLYWVWPSPAANGPFTEVLRESVLRAWREPVSIASPIAT